MHENLERVQSVYDMYERGELPRPEKHEVNPGLELGSKENYVYFTLPCAINYQRNSPAMWQSALDTYLDDETRFLFTPEQVASASFTDVQTAMRKHKLALKTNKDPEAWQRLSTTFAEHYDSNPMNVLPEGEYSIARTLQIVQKEKKNLFPYIGGIKLSNYWLFILSRFTNAAEAFVDPHELSIIPDVHVIRASRKLGIVGDDAKPIDVDLAWRPLLKEMGIMPAKMHGALWLWSRAGMLDSYTDVSNVDEPQQQSLF